MTKDGLVEKIACDAGIPKKDAEVALKSVTSAISGALANGDDVVLVGFGTFRVSQRAARAGRNPRTGETIQIAASKGVKFKAGKVLKDAVK